jgi:HlyD family secretion protein
VLDNIDQFDVVVPFEESDAVRISNNQRVNVSFDAIPDLTLPGTVVSVSPSATALSGVISYYATVALNQGDPRLKNGQTAQAAVLTNEVDNVLTVPNSAVHREGGRTTVTVQGFDGSKTVEFQAGAVGDERTQVVSGLTAGDEVVVPGGSR